MKYKNNFVIHSMKQLIDINKGLTDFNANISITSQNEDDVFWYLNGDPERKPELPSWISPVKQEDFDHFGIREFQDYYVFDWSETFFEISVQNTSEIKTWKWYVI